MKVGIILAAVAAFAVAVMTGSAVAVDDVKPVACNGLAFQDPAGDNESLAVPANQTGPYTDLTGGFIKYDPAKGDEAMTYNLVVADLATAVPPGYVTLSWVAYYPGAEGERWVRAVSDFGGNLEFEYGRIEPLPERPTSIYEGDTKGKMFEGPDGVAQIVIPKDHLKPGDSPKALYGNTLQSQTGLPASTNAPSRGLSWAMDLAPDTEGEANATQTIAECPAGGGTPPPGGGGPTPPAGGGGGTPPPTTETPTGSRSLPVTLLTKSIRAKKAKKKLKLKLRSSEKITGVDAQFRKGTKVLSKGRLAQLDGAGTLSLKIKKALKKGTYALDLAGSDSSGKRLLKSFAFKVKK